MEWIRTPRWPVIPATGVVILLILAGGVLLWQQTMSTPLCPFRNVTGYPCPGCGATRAVEAGLRGDVAAAWRQNPLLVVVGVVGALLLALKVGLGRAPRWDLSPQGKVLVGAALGVSLIANWGYLIHRHVQA